MTTFAPAAALRNTAARPNVRGWALAATVYFLAVFHRSSLGVAGLLAEDRFGITAAQLGAFVLLQIGVYAVMQIPTGVLVDRYGPRRLLVAAAGLMAFGQLLFAIAPSYPLALLARALLGCGDAMTFVSVLRFAAQHFSPRRYPLLVALTSTIGMAGNMLATLPLEQLLQHAGWVASFAGAGCLSVLSGIAVWTLLDDRAPRPSPVRGAPELRAGVVAVSRRVASAWMLPGTRLGFWVHFASMSTATALALLWGQPYLVKGAGFTSSAASAVLLLGVIVAGGGGMLVGWFIGQHPNLRIALALMVCAVTVIGWTFVVFALGDHPSHVVVAALFAITMLGGPASMVAFAVARDYNDPRVFGTATGAVNVGGFVATAVVAILFGEVVTWLGGTSAQHLRYALLVPVAVQLYGASRVFVWLRRVRALVASRQRRGTPVPVAVNRRYFWDARWDAREDSLTR
jgi:predicted MFS family arabinose efflux permease